MTLLAAPVGPVAPVAPVDPVAPDGPVEPLRLPDVRTSCLAMSVAELTLLTFGTTIFGGHFDISFSLCNGVHDAG